jgi:uncharacterized RDD family membrane protein YckC/Tfp pilus assembly major pilin PilA
MPEARPLYAGFWRRAAAALLDGFLLTIANVVVLVVVSERLGAMLAMLAVDGLYYTLLTSSQAQATFGKRACGIKVVDRHGGRIGSGRAAARYCAGWLSILCAGAGFAAAAFTARKQALHDLICATLVVNREASADEVVAGGKTMPMTAGVGTLAVILVLGAFFGGIFAGIAIPAYRDHDVRAKVQEALAAVAPLKKNVERAYAEKRPIEAGFFPVASPHARGGQITAQGHVILTLADGVANGGRVRYVPTEVAGPVGWSCSSDDVANKYLPAACRR